MKAEIEEERKMGDSTEQWSKSLSLKPEDHEWVLEVTRHFFHGVCVLSSRQLSYKDIWKLKPIYLLEKAGIRIMMDFRSGTAIQENFQISD